MSSGFKELVINAQERAVSTDINRLQKFKSAGIAELLRYMLNVTGNDDLDAGSVMAEHTTVESPLRAEIMNGFLIRPQAGNLDLYMDPGVMMALSPDGAADDSAYKYVSDAGIATPGALTMTGNVGISPRIDVIEVRVGTSAVETDNRDIFDITSGLFTATSVTKANASNASGANIRVRQGTVGGGFASVGVASGWLPLCIASVPAGATSNNQITFWDVRPLISDREFGAIALSRAMPSYKNMRMQVNNGSNTNAAYNGLMNGLAEVSVGGRRLGGTLRRGTPGTDGDFVNLNDAANQQNGLTLVADTLYYVYLTTPFGLPRWARYTDGPAGRVPRSPRGIPVLSHLPPTNAGRPTSALPLPTSTGLGSSASATDCVFLTAAPYTDGFLKGANAEGDEVIWSPTTSGTLYALVGTIIGAYSANFSLNMALVPATAKAILVEFELTWAAAQTGRMHMTVHYPNDAGGNADNNIYGYHRIGDLVADRVLSKRVWVPLPTTFPAAAQTIQCFNVIYNLGTDPTTARAHIVGFKY